jgi:hypothetical protein
MLTHREVEFMPRGSEFASLPKSNINADKGTDKGFMHRDDSDGFAGSERPTPSQVKEEPNKN